MKKSKSMVVLFLTPALLFFILTFVYPIIRSVIMSLYSIDNVTARFSAWKFCGITNYVKLFTTKTFLISVWNLLRIWLIGGSVVMILALLFAVILTSGVRGKKFFRAIIFMPYIISAIALATMWLQFVFSSQFGLLKPIADAFKFQWLDSRHKFWSLMIAYCYGMVGYHMLIFMSGIERIGTEYFEAATIDGASKSRQFHYITFPLLRGVIKTNITMWSISSVGFFVWSQMFSAVTTDTNVITPMVYFYTQMFGSANAMTERNAGLGAAVGVLSALFVVIVFLLANYLIKEDDLEF